MLTGIVLLLVATACWIVGDPVQAMLWSWLESKSWIVSDSATKPPEQPQQVPMPALEIPDTVVAYCNGWWDQWAREESLERVKRLYMEHGDWDLAFQALLRQDKVKG